MDIKIENINIRKAKLSDIEEIAGLWIGLATEMEKHHKLNQLDVKRDSEDPPEKLKQNYKKLILDSKYEVFVAESNNTVIGYIDLQHKYSDLLQFDSSILIRQLYVQPKYRNNGIGTSLLNKVTSYSKETSAQYITVPVEWENTDAQRLYKSQGFSEKQIRLVSEC